MVKNDNSNALPYIEGVHRTGRIWMVSGLLLLLAVPATICLHYGVWPAATDFLKGFVGIAPIFWVVAVIEVFTYVPMLGAGGSYLGFVTGNMTNLKVPCALNAIEATKSEPGSEQREVVSTIAIATSSIVTTLVIAAGVLLIVPLRPVLESATLAPAFKNILPALFGALAVVLISKSPKVAIAPIGFMLILFVAVPSLAGTVGILVPVGVIVALVAARILYKKGKL